MARDNPLSSAQMQAVLAQLRQDSAGGKGGRRRSPLRLYLEQAYDDLIKLDVNWRALAHLLDDAGLTDAMGYPPTATSLQSAWARIRAARASQPKPRRERQSEFPEPASDSEPAPIFGTIRPLGSPRRKKDP